MIDLPSWLQPDTPYLLGFSGGRDSVALLHHLTSSGFKNIIACHLNHQLRGEESARDERFVRRLETPFEIGQCDVSSYANEHSLSLETAARQCRHEFFERCASKYGTSLVLLAHHADDQAETLLFNLLRGSNGLKGMKEKTPIGKLTFLRPLLNVRRAEINDYIEQHDLAYCEDSSNQDNFATRNRFRHEVMPLLNDILDRDPVPALLRAAEQENPLKNVLEDFKLLDPQERLFLPTLRGLPEAIQKEALYRFLKKEEVSEISCDLINRSLTLLTPDGPPSVNLPGGLRLRRKESRLFISQ